MGDKPAPLSTNTVNSGNESAPTKVPLSSATPSTEEIDDDWGAAPDPPIQSVSPDSMAGAAASEPAIPSVISSSPVTDDVDSGWLAEPQHESALESPIFPADPPLPSDLAGRTTRALTSDSARRVAEEASRETAPSSASSPPVSSNSSASEHAAKGGESARVSRKNLKAEAPVATAAALPASRGRPLLPLFALVAVAGLVVWFLRRAEPAPPSPEPTRAAEPPSAVAPTRTGASASPDPIPAPAAPVAPTHSAAAATVPLDQGVAREAEPPIAPSAEAPVASASAVSPEKIVVVLKVRPPHARIFRHGKEVGPSPVRIELTRGERRFFEVGANGYMTRKVIVDGSELEMTVGLRAVEPMSGAPPPTAK